MRLNRTTVAVDGLLSVINRCEILNQLGRIMLNKSLPILQCGPFTIRERPLLAIDWGRLRLHTARLVTRGRVQPVSSPSFSDAESS